MHRIFSFFIFFFFNYYPFFLQGYSHFYLGFIIMYALESSLEIFSHITRNCINIYVFIVYLRQGKWLPLKCQGKNTQWHNSDSHHARRCNYLHAETKQPYFLLGAQQQARQQQVSCYKVLHKTSFKPSTSGNAGTEFLATCSTSLCKYGMLTNVMVTLW